VANPCQRLGEDSYASLTMSRHNRYAALIERLSPVGPRDGRMKLMVDLLWDAFGQHQPISWVGFYLDRPDQPDDARLVLGYCRDKPACSPIGLHGVCGQALRNCAVRIIDDVNELGEAYIACDPRDRSEIVLPLCDETGRGWGVLDVDSWETGAFDQTDARGMNAMLIAAGLTVDRDQLLE
jgi:putative methionine-R-sulfoxide reductase with GAF domain